MEAKAIALMVDGEELGGRNKKTTAARLIHVT
jgi:hypothetical protein